MLQLLLERGQSYEDIGSLLGSDVSEIRSRARGALKDMGGADPDAEVSLTDYLLGQADPIGRADAARHLQAAPEANALASKLVTQLRLIAPGAELPTIPPAGKPATSRFAPPASSSDIKKGAEKPGPAPPAPGSPSGSGSGLSGSQKKLIGALAGGALIVLVVVLLVAGVFSGGGGNSSGSDSGTTTADTSKSQNASDKNSKIVRAVLTPVGSADAKAKGVAIFGQLRGQPVLQVIVKGLEPTADGENYSIWLYRSDKAAFRLSGVRVGKTRGIAAQIPIPQQVISFISNGTFPQIDISLAKDADLQAEAAKDKQKKKLTLNHIGDSVMRGDISGPGIKSTAGGQG